MSHAKSGFKRKKSTANNSGSSGWPGWRYMLPYRKQSIISASRFVNHRKYSLRLLGEFSNLSTVVTVADPSLYLINLSRIRRKPGDWP